MQSRALQHTRWGTFGRPMRDRNETVTGLFDFQDLVGYH